MNGSSWNANSGCLNEASITNDDTLVGINYSLSTLYYTTNPTASAPTWVVVGTGWTHAAGLSATAAVGTKGTTLYNIDLTNKTSTAFPGSLSVSSLTTTGDFELFVVTTSNTVYQWNFNATSPSWQKMTGTASSIFGSTIGSLFTLTSNTPYHFLGIALSASATVSGYFDCNEFPNGCPPGAVHTAKATTQFPHSYYTTHTASSWGSPSTQLNATMYDVSSACDPLYGDPSSAECALEQASGGTVNCSIMGRLFSQVFSFGLPAALGEVLLKNLSGATGVECSSIFGYFTTCAFDVTQWCTNQPTYTASGVIDSPPGEAGWWATYACTIWNGGIGKCAFIPGTAIKTAVPGPAYCTNPQP